MDTSSGYSFLVKLSCRKKTSRECECGIVANDIDRHKVFSCKQLLSQRTTLFEGITDAMDVEHSVSFESHDEDSILADLLGGDNTPLGRLPYDQWSIIITNIANTIYSWTMHFNPTY